MRDAVARSPRPARRGRQHRVYIYIRYGKIARRGRGGGADARRPRPPPAWSAEGCWTGRRAYLQTGQRLMRGARRVRRERDRADHPGRWRPRVGGRGQHTHTHGLAAAHADAVARARILLNPFHQRFMGEVSATGDVENGAPCSRSEFVAARDPSRRARSHSRWPNDAVSTRRPPRGASWPRRRRSLAPAWVAIGRSGSRASHRAGRPEESRRRASGVFLIAPESSSTPPAG